MIRNQYFKLILLCSALAYYSTSQADDLKVSLGQKLFFDNNLSLQRNQSCSSCHNPASGFIDNRDNGVNAAASLGDDGISIGDRNAPSAAYASYTPDFYFDSSKDVYVGGMFWDGRAKDLAAQAGGPPLNPGEMAMPDKKSVIERIKENDNYVDLFRKIYGQDIFNNIDKSYAAMTDSIAAFEKTEFFSPFDSKYDRYLKGEYELSIQEELGMSLFFSNNNTNCSTCHVLKGEDKQGETFSNYQYHNIGIPVNSALRNKNGSSAEVIDHGLLNNPEVNNIKQDGKFKVPTLRNIAVTAPYMHNGVFKDLKTVLKFYDHYNNDKRKINPETGKPWREAEVEETINRKDLKSKALSDKKIDALIAFMKTLTDKRYELNQ